jgi:hypothetical protein
MNIRKFLANTWEGSVVKITAASALGALSSYIVTSEVHPFVVAIAPAILVPIVNALNDLDSRYGKGKRPAYYDLASAPEVEHPDERGL